MMVLGGCCSVDGLGNMLLLLGLELREMIHCSGKGWKKGRVCEGGGKKKQ